MPTRPAEPNLAYIYDIAGRVYDVNNSGAIPKYYYDRLGRAVDVNDPQNRLVSYEYDSRGLRTKLTYPDNGNLAYDGRFRYYYDCENRLIDINDATNVRVASYAYDYQGRRISRTIYGSPNVTIRYAYDGDRIIAEYNGSGVLLRKFIYGPGIDEPICLIDVGNGNATCYYHRDGRGSVVALSNVNKVLVERYAYDVFGRPTICDPNGTRLDESAWGNPDLFTGRAYDAESGLYYYRARYYDYATARFLQPDPIGYADGLNLYAYAGNDPPTWVDPYGLWYSRFDSSGHGVWTG